MLLGLLKKQGLFLETGDFSSGEGSVADSQGAGVDGDNDGLDTQYDTGDGTGTDDGDAGVVAQQVKTPQSQEQNAAFAKMRRELDQYKRELATRDQWVADNFGQSHGITTWAEYQAAVQRTSQQQQQAQQAQIYQYHKQKEEELRSYGLDPNQIREFFRTDPAFIQMQQENQQLKGQLQLQKQQAEQEKHFQNIEQGKKMIMDDHKRLKEEYGDLVPAAKNFDDLIEKLDPAVIEKMQRGYSLEDAFISANKAAILKRSKAAAKQQTLNSLNGKAHLKTEGDGASEGGDIHISPDTLQMYMDQGMTKKQAMAFHKKLYG
jgi:hypothetical protein